MENKKQYKAEFFTSRNTTINIDIFARSFAEALRVAKNKGNKFPIIVDDNNNGWAEVENGKVVSATTELYFNLI